ncbi:MAG: sugar ABC transporter substrate-binding protein [Micrococcales bacterium]|nr:MAG: sugar ABC transporter substrate-binding protein [Micrococcales bacterium]
MVFRARRTTALIGTSAAVVLALSACASDDSSSSGGGGGAAADMSIDCSAYEGFGDLKGTEVDVYTTVVAPEDESYIESFKPFEECTGVTVNYEGSKEFEAQLPVRVAGGNAPDIALIPQPGLLKTMVKTGKVVQAPAETLANVDELFGEDWKAYGTVDGTFYAAPLGANVKSFVWYSPSMFEEGGYEVPETWDDLMSLTEDIASKAENDAKPWCAGFGSGDATGWPGTDWLEDMVLRGGGPEVYDQWVTHEIPFNDPQIVESLGLASAILKNDKYVNGGLGDVRTVATTSFQDAGLPIQDGSCYMHRQASFYASNWPEGTEVAADGDVWAFHLPGKDADGEKPVLGGGDFAAAFTDRPEVKAFQTYLSSADWANNKAMATVNGGWVSANKELDAANLVSPIDRLSAEILQDPDAVFRFDGSDLMPSAVGAGTFWNRPPLRAPRERRVATP